MKIIHPCPIEELAESVVDSWKSVCQCTAKFLRHVWELDLRQGYKQWGYTSMNNLVLLCTHHHRLLHEGGFQILSHPAGGHYFANPDGQPLDVGPHQTLAEGEEVSALRPWSDGKEMLSAAADSLASGACC